MPIRFQSSLVRAPSSTAHGNYQDNVHCSCLEPLFLSLLSTYVYVQACVPFVYHMHAGSCRGQKRLWLPLEANHRPWRAHGSSGNQGWVLCKNSEHPYPELSVQPLGRFWTMLDASLIPGLCWLCLGPLCGMPFHTNHRDCLGTELPYISAAEFINLSLSHDFFKITASHQGGDAQRL